MPVCPIRGQCISLPRPGSPHHVLAHRDHRCVVTRFHTILYCEAMALYSLPLQCDTVRPTQGRVGRCCSLSSAAGSDLRRINRGHLDRAPPMIIADARKNALGILEAAGRGSAYRCSPDMRAGSMTTVLLDWDLLFDQLPGPMSYNGAMIHRISVVACIYSRIHRCRLHL